MIEPARILRLVLPGYELPVRGHHGVTHWARVFENGSRLAGSTGADPDVTALFALFHDVRRVNESVDPGHGLRGAELARELRGVAFELDDAAFARLHEACRRHTDGEVSGDPTIQACWDADRLDLGRVGIEPLPELLGSDAARALLPWANERADRAFEPAFVKADWRV